MVATSDIAKLYNVETGALNRQGKRNIERFPKNFMFQLTNEEYNSLRFQNGTIKSGRGQHSKYLQYVFTEQGIKLLKEVKLY